MRQIPPPFYEEISKDLFYISLSRKNSNSKEYLSTIFGNHGEGVQLQFKISVKPAADLRPINYQSPARQIIKEINNKLSESNHVPFIPWTISKIGAFYLPSELKIENEVRFLIKRYKCGIEATKNDGNYEYWPIQLAKETPFGRFDLTEITCGPGCTPTEVQNRIKGTKLEGTTITSGT